jgi:hypothetical protein
VTVQPSPADFAVYVKVRREAIPLLFARIFSMGFSDVEASAVAEAAAAGEIACMKPFAIPDESYTPDDIGQLDTLKAADENAATGSGVDSYFFPIVLPHDPNIRQTCRQAGNEWGGFHPKGGIMGGNCGETNPPGSNSCWYRANICNENCAVMSTGTDYPVQKGDMDGPSAQGVNALLAGDPDVEWDPDTQRLTRDGEPIEFSETGRVIKVALYDKSTYYHPSQTMIQFTGFAYWFLEFANATNTSQHQYYNPAEQAPILGRFLFYAPGTAGGEMAGPFSRYLRLIQ